MTRSAIIQARVRPEIKFAGEQVLRSIGLTMTEAMELFIRRLVIDQKLPFEVSALDDGTFDAIVAAWEKKAEETKAVNIAVSNGRKTKRQKRE